MTDRFRTWLLLTGNRYGLAGGILLVMTGVALLPILLSAGVRDTSPLFYVGSALIGGNITLITVVVTITQVILSEELSSPGSLRDEIEDTADFRHTALDDQTPPTDPSDFLQQLLRQTGEHARSLDGLLPDSAADASRQLHTDLPVQCAQVGEQLESAPETLSKIIVPLLDIDYGTYIHVCHHVQSNYDDEAREQLLTTLDALASDLENVNIAQKYFATEFIKEELAELSRSLLYIAIGAVSLPLALLYQLTLYPGATPPAQPLLVGIALATLFGLLPLALLISSVLRMAIVAQYFAGITPFRV